MTSRLEIKRSYKRVTFQTPVLLFDEKQLSSNIFCLDIPRLPRQSSLTMDTPRQRSTQTAPLNWSRSNCSETIHLFPHHEGHCAPCVLVLDLNIYRAQSDNYKIIFYGGGGAVKGELLRHRDFCRCVERTDSSLLSPD